MDVDKRTSSGCRFKWMRRSQINAITTQNIAAATNRVAIRETNIVLI